ncbi:hypothetical protein PoB_005102200 [Plakobranchus ocellatus]|uniref:Uncharacterized protein n=1 Tax=Plakobranchus ocellatus TaxID=259542 RepID=A0AAV4BZI7_9GAST|nr:hypothetical protein PoB_005102200 [Plakobranchus ocellatus]
MTIALSLQGRSQLICPTKVCQQWTTWAYGKKRLADFRIKGTRELTQHPCALIPLLHPMNPNAAADVRPLIRPGRAVVTHQIKPYIRFDGCRS